MQRKGAWSEDVFCLNVSVAAAALSHCAHHSLASTVASAAAAKTPVHLSDHLPPPWTLLLLPW